VLTTYIYSVRDNSGKLIKGSMDASSEADLVDKLHKMGCTPIKIEESSEEEVKSDDILERFKRVKPSDMIMFNLQLASMIDAGLTILGSLKIISLQTTNPKLKVIVGGLHASISEGSSFSEALEKHPEVFPSLFVSMVSAGEIGGTLSVVLSRYAAYVEQQEELKQKIKGALLYPSILLFVGLAVIVFIVSFVMPKFITIFLNANVPLPLPTILIYNFGMGIKNYWYIILFVFLVSFLSAKMYIRTKRGKSQFDKLVLRIPIIGPLARRIVVVRFAYALANLLESGVPLLQALDSTGNIVGNTVFSDEIKNVRANVEKGERLGQALQSGNKFPVDVVQLVSVGEDTGKIYKMLYKIAEFYEITANRTIKKLITLIEPFFIVLMGGMVGVIVPAMVLPLFDLVKTIQR